MFKQEQGNKNESLQTNNLQISLDDFDFAESSLDLLLRSKDILPKFVYEYVRQ